MYRASAASSQNKRSRKPLGVAIYLCVLLTLIAIVSQLARAETYDVTPVEDEIQLDKQYIDGILAPIALYPDSLLSHIFIASTYPLEVVKAARWRDNHLEMDADEALKAVENKKWDPSVKALVAFPDLLERLSNDVDWLQQIGDAFLNDETMVLNRVQHLRHKAKEYGSLRDNDYIDVEYDDDQIIIQPVEERVVYVPVYDTRVVYGDWWWRTRPVVWQRPDHYHWHDGFSWSTRIVFQPRYYHYSGFHWRDRHVVVNHHIYHNSYRYDHRYNRRPIVRNTEWHNNGYKRWQHNPWHRGNVRYRHVQPNVVKRFNDGSYKKQRTMSRQHQLQKVRSYSNDNRHSLTQRIQHTQSGSEKSYNRHRSHIKQRTASATRTKSVIRSPQKQRYATGVSQPKQPTTAVRSASRYPQKTQMRTQAVKRQIKSHSQTRQPNRSRQITHGGRASGKAVYNQKVK